MFDKLRQIEERYAELNRSLSDPQVIGQPAVYAMNRDRKSVV